MEPAADTTPPERPSCLLCKQAQTDIVQNLFQRPKLLRKISSATGQNLLADPCYPNSICTDCIGTVSYHAEYASRVQHRLNELRTEYYGGGSRSVTTNDGHSSTGCVPVLPPATSDHSSDQLWSTDNVATTMRRPNSDGSNNNNNKNMYSKYGKRSSESENGGGDQLDNGDESADVDVTGGLVPVGDANCIEAVDHSLLEPMYACSELVAVTESGGEIHRHNNAVNERQKARSQHACPNCCRIFQLAYNLKRHARKCRRPSIGRRNAPVVDIQMAASSEAAAAVATPSPRIFYCPVADCQQTGFTSSGLRQHTIEEHRRTFECDWCHDKSPTTPYDLDWHVATCVTRLRQLEANTTELGDSELATITSNASGPHAVRATPSRCSYRIAARRFSERSGSMRLRSLSVDSSVSTTSSFWSLASQRSMVDSVNDEHDDFDQPDLLLDENDREQHRLAISRCKMRRRYGRSRLRRSGRTPFECTVELCSFVTDTMKGLLEHELVQHGIQMRYYCYTCKEWFSSRKMLQQHQSNHKSGPHECTVCLRMLDDEYRLQIHHQLHHEKRALHNCSECPRRFLSHKDLCEHQLEEVGVRNGHEHWSAYKKSSGKTSAIAHRLMRTSTRPLEAAVEATQTDRHRVSVPVQLNPAKTVSESRIERMRMPLVSSLVRTNIWSGVRLPGVSRSGDYFIIRRKIVGPSRMSTDPEPPIAVSASANSDAIPPTAKQQRPNEDGIRKDSASVVCPSPLSARSNQSWYTISSTRKSDNINQSSTHENRQDGVGSKQSFRNPHWRQLNRAFNRQMLCLSPPFDALVDDPMSYESVPLMCRSNDDPTIGMAICKTDAAVETANLSDNEDVSRPFRLFR